MGILSWGGGLNLIVAGKFSCRKQELCSAFADCLPRFCVNVMLEAVPVCYFCGLCVAHRTDTSFEGPCLAAIIAQWVCTL